MRGAAIGGGIVLALAVGWFCVSHIVMHAALADALGESLGVALGLLMVASVVGAVRSNQSAPPGDH